VKDKGEKVRRLRPRRILLLTVVLLLLGSNFTLRCFHRTLAGFESEGTWELSMLCEVLSAYNAEDIRRWGWTLFTASDCLWDLRMDRCIPSITSIVQCAGRIHHISAEIERS